jgi:hypothetical protein
MTTRDEAPSMAPRPAQAEAAGWRQIARGLYTFGSARGVNLGAARMGGRAV